jgi:beta-lactamase regulating signal transducer with metallopeptidase domain
MLYVIMVTLLLSFGAYVAERAARLSRGGTRWIWLTAIVASLAIPTVIASVTVQLPNVATPTVAQKIIVLRQATTQALSPVTWISGTATAPSRWHSFDSLLTLLWRGASAAMLLGLIASGVHLGLRKRKWQAATVAGVDVLVTEDVGPAVVGLLRPRIVVPHWVTLATPRSQAAVLAHEQSHLDAGDPRLFTLALALLVFMPWNLPLWWQLRRLRCAIEVDCDARVLRGGIDPTHYGETLISVCERQSAYVGAVAAMSESRSFLEERLRIMLSKPVKWRRVGMATLAGVSLALTALAAQVSPPNAADDQAAGRAPAATAPGADKNGERVAIKLPAATLDRYVGDYKLTDQIFVNVKRDGDALYAKVTGQPSYEIFPESADHFFWKVVDAQIAFANDGSGKAPSAVLHQYGHDMPMTRVDSATVAQFEANLQARIQSSTPNPNSEPMLRKTLAAIASGQPNYEDMEPVLADAVRKQLPQIVTLEKQLGPVTSIKFNGVGDAGYDGFVVQHENGRLQTRIILSTDGKIAGLQSTMLP